MHEQINKYAGDGRRLRQDILDIGSALGFGRVVVGSLDPLPQLEQYRDWLERGFAADMKYLQRDPTRRVTPSATFTPALSVLVCQVSYYSELPPPPKDIVWGRVARYAVGLDYHQILRQKLDIYVQEIEKLLGRRLACRTVTDDAALYEQALAARHGLGFGGKNTLIIGPGAAGTYNLIGEIFLDVELDCDGPYLGSCGKCVRCQSGCPTDAIVSLPDGGTGERHAVDARRCISYLTIENKGAIEAGLREGLGDWVFGCDVCQEVCPYNRRPPPCPWPELGPAAGAGHYLDLLVLLEMDEASFRQRYRKTPLARPKLRGLQRNALTVLGNKLSLAETTGQKKKISEALEGYLLKTTDEMLIEHAQWALLKA